MDLDSLSDKLFLLSEKSKKLDESYKKMVDKIALVDDTNQTYEYFPEKDDNEIMIITVGGQMVRTGVKGIRETGRNTQGVRLVKLDSGDRLQDIAPVITAQKEEAAGEEEEARE